MTDWRRREIDYVEGDDIQPSNLNKARVEAYAREIAELTGFEVGHDPSQLVEDLGGEIHYVNLEDWASEDGSIFVHDNGDFEILLSHYTSPLRDRFTISHELGHYFLHADAGDTPLVAHRSGSTRIEWEANWFAASLLMPADKFKEFAGKHKSLSRIAAKFGVSEDAARVRRDAIC